MLRVSRSITRAVGAAGAALLLAGVGSSSAVATSAQKVPLTETNRDCDGSVIGDEDPAGFGFVVFNVTGSNQLVAQLVVKGAEPNAEYGVRVIQVPDTATGDCGDFRGPYEAYLTTDADGNANANVHEMLIDGASGAFVALNKTDAASTEYFTTAPSA